MCKLELPMHANSQASELASEIAVKRGKFVVVALIAAAAVLYLVMQSIDVPKTSRRIDVTDSRVTGASRDDPDNAAASATVVERVGVRPFTRPTEYNAFDFRSLLARSLEEAALGDPASQYRASVMLRDCRDRHMNSQVASSLRAKGLPESHIALLQERSSRCADVANTMGRENAIASKRWAELALQQAFPVAVASDLLLAGVPSGASEIDVNLLAAVVSASDDRILRYESYFLVLVAMEKRHAATGMEADHVVRTAWTLLHCRESWECDLDATLDSLLRELTPSSLNAAIDLATQLQTSIENGNWAEVRMH